MRVFATREARVPAIRDESLGTTDLHMPGFLERRLRVFHENCTTKSELDFRNAITAIIINAILPDKYSDTEAGSNTQVCDPATVTANSDKSDL